jgi:hypothetical protein
LVRQVSNNLANTLVVLKDFDCLLLRPGQVFTGVVVSQAKAGKQYLLKTGENLLPVSSEKPLQIGQKIRLHVLGFRGEDLLVEKLPSIMEQQECKKTNVIAKALEKYGVKGEKEIAVIKKVILKLPVEENTAIRYLLDPHLLAALLLPTEKREDVYNKLEITRYNGVLIKEDVWEVSLELQLPALGRMELKIKKQGENLYMQIWAESGKTENILQKRKKELETFCTSVEIFPFEEGPLLITNHLDNIDLTV